MKQANGVEPRFDVDLEYGRGGEEQIFELFKSIAAGNGRVEVKRKRVLDFKFYCETHADNGRNGDYKPSGISTTKSDTWAVVFGDTGYGILVPTRELKSMLTDPTSRDAFETDGDCPTKGKLIDLTTLLYRIKRRRQEQERPQASQHANTKTFDASNFTVDDINW